MTNILVLLLLLMASAASVEHVINVEGKYKDFRIFAKRENLNIDPIHGIAQPYEWVLRKVQFFKGNTYGRRSLIEFNSSSTSSDRDPDDALKYQACATVYGE